MWDVAHPQPAGGDGFERKLCRTLARRRRRSSSPRLEPKDAASLAKWREVVGGGVEAILGRGLPAASDLEFEKTEKTELGDYVRFAGLLQNKARGEELPLAFLHPKKWNGRAVIWLSEQGKAAIFDGGRLAAPKSSGCWTRACSVVGVDLLFQGEFLADGAAGREEPHA